MGTDRAGQAVGDQAGIGMNPEADEQSNNQMADREAATGGIGSGGF